MSNTELFDGEYIPLARTLAKETVDAVRESEDYKRYKRGWLRRIEEAHRNSKLQASSTIAFYHVKNESIRLLLSDLIDSGYAVTAEETVDGDIKITVSWAEVYINQL